MKSTWRIPDSSVSVLGLGYKTQYVLIPRPAIQLPLYNSRRYKGGLISRVIGLSTSRDTAGYNLLKTEEHKRSSLFYHSFLL